MNSWHSYPSIYTVGHKLVKDILQSEVTIEEKIDGSQFSFGRDLNGDLHIRSKGAIINPAFPEKMFSEAVAVVKELPLTPEWTYRGEYLKKPKHNTLAYSRVPKNHIIIFDINIGEEAYLSYEGKAAEAYRLGFETVPCIFRGLFTTMDQFHTMLERESILGGQKIEGFVIKNYNMFGPDKKVLMAKYVSEAFKEIHQGEWRKSNPSKGDILDGIITALRTPARWHKAVQHLRDQGLITDSPQDIGLLLKEIHQDIDKEMLDEISKMLMDAFLTRIKRGVCSGFPEWYKEQLMKKQLET